MQEEIKDCLGRALVEDDVDARWLTEQSTVQPSSAHGAHPDPGSTAGSGAESSEDEQPRPKGLSRKLSAWQWIGQLIDVILCIC